MSLFGSNKTCESRKLHLIKNVMLKVYHLSKNNKHVLNHLSQQVLLKSSKGHKRYLQVAVNIVDIFVCCDKSSYIFRSVKDDDSITQAEGIDRSGKEV